MAAECTTRSGFRFQRKLAIDFEGGEITQEAGLVLLREFDERLGLTQALSECVVDRRDRRYVKHTTSALLRQRIYQIAAGYEDANDATYLRMDPTFQTVVGRLGTPLASQPTLSRLERTTTWKEIHRLGRAQLDWFCRHGQGKGRELILDIDSTQDPTHGQQELSFYNGHYDGHVYHPLLVFEGDGGFLLGSRLRAGNESGVTRLVPMLERIVPGLRRLQGKKLVVRADGDFGCRELIEYCRGRGMEFVLGLRGNSRLEPWIEPIRKKLQATYEATGKAQRRYTSFRYQARTWKRPERVVAMVEHTGQGPNLRLIVTNRRGRAKEIFRFYNQRGQAENYIKELKNEVAADRLSCHGFRANAFRLALHGLTYNLLTLFRQHALARTRLARASIGTIRLRLLKIGARVKRTTRRWWFHLASGWPGQPLFLGVLDAMPRAPG